MNKANKAGVFVIIFWLLIVMLPGPCPAITKHRNSTSQAGKCYLAADKIFHCFISFGLTAAARDQGVSRGNALVLTGAIGLAKELFDAFVAGKYIDPADLCFDFLGIALAFAFR